MILSASRDKTVLVWSLTRAEGQYGYPKRALVGHSHYVSDVVISSDSSFALSGSWDGTLRLWDINTGDCTRTFKGHTKVGNAHLHCSTSPLSPIAPAPEPPRALPEPHQWSLCVPGLFPHWISAWGGVLQVYHVAFLIPTL